MNDEYYILEDGEKAGPFSFDELTERGIDIDSSILVPGSDTWQNASYLPEFNEYFESQGFYFPTEGNLAGFGWRTLASVIDYIVVSLIAGLIDIKAGWLVFPASTAFNPTLMLTNLSQRSLMIIELSFVVVFVLYNTIFEATDMRGSIGKRTCGLKVVDADGRKLSFLMAVARNIGAVTVYHIFGLIFLIISFFFSDRQQTWYDKQTKAYVIKPE